jgi:hypothetical protein
MAIIKRLSLFIFFALIFSACSISGKFNDTQQINLTPFSENVAAMASELDYGFDKIRSVHSKWYFNLNALKLKRLLNLEKLVTNEIHFIVKYSNRIVLLSNSNLSMVEKNTELTRYINKMYSRFSNSKSLSISSEEKTQIIENIKKQEKFLNALQSAQPFIDELSRYANRLLDQLKKAEVELAIHQVKKIDSENKHLKLLMLSLKKNEEQITSAIVLLNSYANGNESAFIELKKSKVLMEQSLIQSKDSLTHNQVNLLKKHLLNKLTENTNFYTQIDPSYQRYILAQTELILLEKVHDAEIRKIRIIFITFASAHRKMTSGVVKAAEWFDINDTPKLLFNLLPIPL